MSNPTITLDLGTALGLAIVLALPWIALALAVGLQLGTTWATDPYLTRGRPIRRSGVQQPYRHGED